jgi:UDP-glucose:(glucosyl)LPS alpha-1,2-glucosyltransferase
MASTTPDIAIVLPPLDGFGPRNCGVTGQIVRRLAGVPGFRTTVFGGRQASPTFSDVPFRAVNPLSLVPGTINLKYMARLALSFGRLRPSLIEVHDAVGVALGLARFFRHTPVMLFLHGDPPATRRLTTPAERMEILRRMACVVTASEFQRARFMEGLSDPPREPVVLPYGTDLAARPTGIQRSRLVLFAGRMVPEKGADAFVSACAAALPHLPGWRAELIGADEYRMDSPETDYVRIVHAAAHGAGLHPLGYRDHPDVVMAMARAAIAVVPSRGPDAFSLEALEAMANGAALICSPNGALPEIADIAALYADPEKPAEIAAAIRSLAQDERRRAGLVDAAWQRALAHDLPNIQGRLAALRHQILGNGG